VQDYQDVQHRPVNLINFKDFQDSKDLVISILKKFKPNGELELQDQLNQLTLISNISDSLQGNLISARRDELDSPMDTIRKSMLMRDRVRGRALQPERMSALTEHGHSVTEVRNSKKEKKTSSKNSSEYDIAVSSEDDHPSLSKKNL